MEKRVLLILVLILSFSVFSQDKIVKKDGKVLKVIIKEVNEKTIKYVAFEDPNGVLFTIPKGLVKRIDFSYGKKMKVEDQSQDAAFYLDDKKNNFTLNFTAIGGNTLALGYEHALKPGHTVFTELKFYGIGVKTLDEVDRSGFGVDFAYRLKLRPLFANNTYRPKHILHGSYFSPVIGFSTGTFKEDWSGTLSSNTREYKHTIGHFGIQVGQQWIIQNSISLDISTGFHYYVGNSSETGGTSDYFYEQIRAGNMWGTDSKMLSFNIRVGLLTKKKK
jgi:hypothetical protein